MAVKPWAVRYFSPLRAPVPKGAAGSVTTSMPFSLLMTGSSSHGRKFSVEAAQALWRAHVQPAAIVALAAQPAGQARLLEPRQQRKPSRGRAGKKLRPQQRHAGIGQ